MTSRSILWALGLCLAVAVTNRYEGPPHPGSIPGDAYAYFTLAQSAPALPQEDLLFHHAQRIALPYLLGAIHSVVPVPLHRLFQISVVLIEVALLLILAAMLKALSVRHRQAVLVLAILALNPWAFRPYLTFPEMINDLGFMLGLAIMLHGLLARHSAAVLLGQLVASLCRQTGLLLVPLVVVWMWRDRKNWGRIPASRRLALCLATGILAAGVYAATAALAARFASTNENAEHLVGMWSWLTTQFDAFVLAAFLVRAMISPLILLACFLAIAGRRKNTGTGSEFLPILLFGSMCTWAQPLLAGPAITGGNAPRLVTIGLLPICVALAIALRDAGLFTEASGPRRFLGIGALLALGSLHHWYVFAAAPSLGQKVLFGAAYALACAGCFVAIRFEAWRVTPARRVDAA